MDIDASSVQSREVSGDYTDIGDELDDDGPNTVNDATVTAKANIPNWTASFTDIIIEPFTQDSGPCLPVIFDVSVATALDYFNLLFTLEIFSDINEQSNSYAKKKFGETEIILTMLKVCFAGNHS